MGKKSSSARFLEHLQQWSKKLNIDAKLKKNSSNSGAIMEAKILLVNNF